MSIPSALISQIFSLPAQERFELAQQLLDSIEDASEIQLDEQFIAELDRRREEMMRGDETIDDWRAALAEIKASPSRDN